MAEKVVAMYSITLDEARTMYSTVVKEVPSLKYGVLMLLITFLGTWWYRMSLPRPIPGDLPYKKQSAKRILGDAPDVSLRRN